MLDKVLDGKEYVAMHHAHRGIEFALTIPYGRFYDTPRYKVLYRAIRLFTRALWRELS